jgi:2-amino-4-hydroxy-6-hydroxymethyldihydropteridine diphosphokinase
MPQCLISFGANLGARDSAIVTAARHLSQMSEVENFRASRLYETPAIGGPSGQSSFLNGVAVFDTHSRAREVLLWLQELEQRLGRQRHERWAARSIDLDVVLHGSLVGGANDLTVPHPRYTARRFVLRPACDVAPDYRDPRFGWTLGQLADHLDQGNASISLTGGDEVTRRELGCLLESEHRVRVFHAAPMPEPMSVLGTAPMGNRESVFAATQTVIDVEDDQPWVSTFVPALPEPDDRSERCRCVPRLIGRVQWTRPEERWPAPHRIWPSSSQWPEYRLEIDDLNWAAGEIVSALASMRCPLVPIDDDQDWWR